MIMDTVPKLDFFTIPLIAQTNVNVGHTVIQTPFMHMSLWNCVSRPRGLAVSIRFLRFKFYVSMWADGRGSLSVVPRETREGWTLLTVET
jgi:hypothetical protein